MTSILYIMIAGVAGLVVGRPRGERLPYGVAACALGALIGAVALSLPLGDKGPHLFEVAIAPAATGALAGALLVRALLARLMARWG
jgi:hypothetical protein